MWSLAWLEGPWSPPQSLVCTGFSRKVMGYDPCDGSPPREAPHPPLTCAPWDRPPRASRDGTPRPHHALRYAGADWGGALVGGRAWRGAGLRAHRTRERGRLPRAHRSTAPNAVARHTHGRTPAPLGRVVGRAWHSV